MFNAGQVGARLTAALTGLLLLSLTSTVSTRSSRKLLQPGLTGQLPEVAQAHGLFGGGEGGEGASNSRGPPGRDLSRELLVQFDNAASEEDVGAFLQRYPGTNRMRDLGDKLFLLELPLGLAHSEASKRFRDENPGLVKIAEANLPTFLAGPKALPASPLPSPPPPLPAFTAADPTDPYYSSYQWSMNGATGVNAAGAWAAGNTDCSGTAGLVIGVVDQGIDYNFPDLAPNMWVNPNEPIDLVDNDNNGYINDARGWNFMDNTRETAPQNIGSEWHGNVGAGIIAAAANNNAGVAGVCWKARVMSARAFNADGSGTLDAAISAVKYFNKLKLGYKNQLSYGVNVGVINHAWTVQATPDQSGNLPSAVQLLQAEIQASASLGIMHVCAAGNSGVNQEGTSNKAYPAAFAMDHVISVASYNKSMKLDSFSNFGPTTVEIAAPGKDVISTLTYAPDPKSPSGFTANYALNSGTSFAAPHVTGALALYMARYPGATPLQVRNALLASAVKESALSKFVMGGNRLNVGALMKTAPA